MKIYVGIDIAKLNHFAAAISSDGEIIIEPFKFTNDADGFQLLVSKLESFDKNSLIIGLESTAHYGDNLVRYLVTQNLYPAKQGTHAPPVRTRRTFGALFAQSRTADE